MKKLFVIGDSISLHYEPYLRDFIDSYYEYDRKGESLERSVNSFDKNGGDSSMVLAYLKKRIANGLNVDVIMLNCGLHDIKVYKKTSSHKIPINEYKNNLKEISPLASKCSRRTVWLTTTHVDDEQHRKHSYDFDRFNADVIAYNEAAAAVFKDAGAAILDLNTFTCKLGKQVFADHIHFDESVREIQGAFIGGFLIGLAETLDQDSALLQAKKTIMNEAT